MAATDLTLLKSLLQNHLLRMLWAATDLNMLDCTMYALQEVLKIGSHLDREGALPETADWTAGVPVRAGKAGNNLYASLEEDVQASVRPYMDSKYTLVNSPAIPSGVLFGTSAASTFRGWLQLWMRQLINAHCTGVGGGWWLHPCEVDCCVLYNVSYTTAYTHNTPTIHPRPTYTPPHSPTPLSTIRSP